MARVDNPVLVASLYPNGVYRDRAVAVNPGSGGGWILLDGIDLEIAKLCTGSTTQAGIASRLGLPEQRVAANLQLLEDKAVITRGLHELDDDDEAKPPHWTHLYLELTLRCNLACLHCNVGSPALVNLSDSVAWQALEQFAETGSEVTFSGGEPTLVRILPQLIERAVELGLGTGIITNGVRMSESMLDLLRRTETTVCISMDGASADVHDRIRGRGAFDKTMATIERLTAAGMGERLALSHTPVAGGIGQLPAMEQLAAKLGIPTLYVSLPEKRGRLIEHDELALSDEELVGLLRFLYDRMLEPHPEVSIDVTDEGACRRDLTLGLTDSRTNALGSTVRISATGQVFSGSLTDADDFMLGTFPERSLAEIHASSRYHELSRSVRRRATVIPKCRSCVWQNTCAGGIVTAAANDRHNLFDTDVLCDARRQILPEYIGRIADLFAETDS